MPLSTFGRSLVLHCAGALQIKHLQGELERVTLKLRQADKSAAANQQIMVSIHAAAML